MHSLIKYIPLILGYLQKLCIVPYGNIALIIRNVTTTEEFTGDKAIVEIFTYANCKQSISENINSVCICEYQMLLMSGSFKF